MVLVIGQGLKVVIDEGFARGEERLLDATLEIRSQVAQDRGAFNVTGTVGRPIIRRGG